MYAETYKPEFNFVGKNQTEREEVLGAKYEALLKEREELLAELRKFTTIDYSACLEESIAGRDRTRAIAREWLARVREETSYLETVDRLGIRIFVDDLEKQPFVDGEHIKFESGFLRRENVANLAAKGGTSRQGEAHIDIPEIRIAESKLSQAEQLYIFLRHGSVPPVLDTLIHELIHRKHFRKNQKTKLILSEAQAHWNGLIKSGKKEDYSISGLSEEVKDSLKSNDEPTDGVEAALKAIYKLYSYGYNLEDVAKLITGSVYDPSVNRWVPLEDEVESYRREHGLSQVDTQAMQDLWRLNATNEQNKAQLLLFKSIESIVPAAERKKLKKKFFESTIFGCQVYHDKLRGKMACEGNVIYPDYPEFVSEEGQLNGLFFGNVPKELNSDENGSFGIGWYSEQIGKSSLVECVNSPSQQQQLLAILGEFSATVSKELKKRVFSEAVDQWPLFKRRTLAEKILRSLITSQEGAEFYETEYAKEYQLLKAQERKRAMPAKGEEQGHLHRDAINRLKRIEAIAEIFKIKI